MKSPSCPTLAIHENAEVFLGFSPGFSCLNLDMQRVDRRRWAKFAHLPKQPAIRPTTEFPKRGNYFHAARSPQSCG
jgi:hypothetical protein